MDEITLKLNKELCEEINKAIKTRKVKVGLPFLAKIKHAHNNTYDMTFARRNPEKPKELFQTYRIVSSALLSEVYTLARSEINEQKIIKIIELIENDFLEVDTLEGLGM